MEENRKDLTNPKNFFSWVFYGLSATIASVSSIAYFDMRAQRNEAVRRVNEMTDRIWAKEYKIEKLEKENSAKDEIIKYADSTLRQNTTPEVQKILKTK